MLTTVKLYLKLMTNLHFVFETNDYLLFTKTN